MKKIALFALTSVLWLSAAWAQEGDVQPTLLDDVATPSTVEDDLATPSTADDDVINLEFIIEGYAYDETGQPLAAVNVSTGDFSATTDDNGYYQIVGLTAGTYTVSGEKTGYVFDSQQLTLDDDNPVLEINLTSVASGSVSGEQVIVVGAYDCDGSNQVHFNSNAGDDIFSFAADLPGEGIVLSASDFDADQSTDIAASGRNTGNDVLLFNAKGENFVKIITNSNEEGANIAFGDIDGDGELEIVVAKQSKGNRVYLYESDGTAIRAIPVLDDKELTFEIAAADVNGDNAAEILVAVSEKTQDNNLWIYDAEGTLLTSFAALEDDDKYNLGITVEAGDVNGDGMNEIVVAQRYGKGYRVGSYDFSGTLLESFNAFGSKKEEEAEDDDDDDDDSKSKKCKVKKLEGLALAVGNTNDDSKDEIIVSQAGERTVKVFQMDGTLLTRFTAVASNEVITDLSYGDGMQVELPVTDTLPDDPEEPLEDITVIGTPDDPVVVEDREIKGTVQISYAIVANLNINIGAKVKFGPGVKFKNRTSIPKKAYLTSIFPKINISARMKNRLEVDFEAVNLNTQVVEDEATVLEDIQVLTEGNFDVAQDDVTGNLQVDSGDMSYEVCPVEVEEADDAPTGISVEADGSVVFVTSQGLRILTQPVPQDGDTFVLAIDQFGLDSPKLNISGKLRAQGKHDRRHRFGRTDIVSMLVTDSSLSEGLNMLASPYLANVQLATYVFVGKKGKRRQQIIYSVAAQPEIFTDDTVLSAAGLSQVELFYNGTVKFSWGGKLYTGLFDYTADSETTPSTGGLEVETVEDQNGDDIEDIQVIYPDGESQTVFVESAE